MGQVSIPLNGRTYRFVCGDGEEARIEELGAYIRNRIDALSIEFGNASDDRMLVMAVLMITDELFEARAAGALPAPTPAPRARRSNTG